MSTSTIKARAFYPYTVRYMTKEFLDLRNLGKSITHFLQI